MGRAAANTLVSIVREPLPCVPSEVLVGPAAAYALHVQCGLSLPREHPDNLWQGANYRWSERVKLQGVLYVTRGVRYWTTLYHHCRMSDARLGFGYSELIARYNTKYQQSPK